MTKIISERKHLSIKEVKAMLGESEDLEEDERCPRCGGYLVTNYGPGISCTICVDCDYSDYDYYDCE